MIALEELLRQMKGLERRDLVRWVENRWVLPERNVDHASCPVSFGGAPVEHQKVIDSGADRQRIRHHYNRCAPRFKPRLLSHG